MKVDPTGPKKGELCWNGTFHYFPFPITKGNTDMKATSETMAKTLGNIYPLINTAGFYNVSLIGRKRTCLRGHQEKVI